MYIIRIKDYEKKPLLPLILCLSYCALSQNLIDSNFTEKDCNADPLNKKNFFIQSPEETCYLKKWKSIGKAKPQLTSTSGEYVIHINFGKREIQGQKFKTYREYLQADFSQTLEKGVWYKFSAEIKAHQDATVGLSDMDIYFGQNNISNNFTPYQNLPLNPQLKQGNILTPFYLFDYFNTWEKIEKYYKAEGGETFFIIGNFLDTALPFVNISREVLNDSENPVNASCLIKNIKFKKTSPPKKYTDKIPETINAGDEITLNTIGFEPGKATLRKETYPEIENLAKLFNTVSSNIEILGHTDAKGNDADNLALSKNRAMAVAALLEEYGIDKNRLIISGMGDTKPIAENNTFEGRKLNRRVEFKIL